MKGVQIQLSFLRCCIDVSNHSVNLFQYVL